MELTPQQKIGAQEWNKIIQSNVSNAIGSKLDGEFIAANYTPGFNYAVKQQFYNEDTLSTFNTLLAESDGIPVIKNVYSDLYKNVLGTLKYGISKADEIIINQEQQEQAALIGTIIDLYVESGLDDEPQDNADIPYIIRRIREVTGNSYLHLDTKEYPYLSNLCNKLSEYSRLAKFTSSLQNAWDSVSDRIEKIKSNIEKPSRKNGGLETDKDKYYIGWDKLPDTKSLLENLKNEGSNISFSVSIDSFKSDQSMLHFDSNVSVKVPSNWIFNMKIDHDHEFDFSKYCSESSSLDIAFKFIGVSTVAAVPTPISSDNEKGWFAADILEEAAKKSGKDTTGICLNGGRYDPDTLFGKNGMLRRMKTLVISQQPIVTLTFKSANTSELEKYFRQHTEVEFKIFGNIISGTHSNDFSCKVKEHNHDAKTLTVELAPAPLGSYGSLSKQTAYVLGGTAEYFSRE